MASDANYFVYETIPYSYSPLSLASSCPLDNYHSLTRSMRDITAYADLIARVLAADTNQRSSTGIKSKAASDASKGKDANAPSASASALHLCLRPSINWRQSADGFVLSAATPGLRKDELKVELLDDRGESFIEVSGQTLDKHSSKDGEEAPADAAQSKVETKLELRATYGGFRERVRLPRGVDREAMRATYEDGLLVVTIPMNKIGEAKRQKIAIA
jgi:HSP20 family molecular chaperone IbpA